MRITPVQKRFFSRPGRMQIWPGLLFLPDCFHWRRLVLGGFRARGHITHCMGMGGCLVNILCTQSARPPRLAHEGLKVKSGNLLSPALSSTSVWRRGRIHAEVSLHEPAVAWPLNHWRCACGLTRHLDLFRRNESVGETPTEATGTVALPGKGDVVCGQNGRCLSLNPHLSLALSPPIRWERRGDGRRSRLSVPSVPL